MQVGQTIGKQGPDGQTRPGRRHLVKVGYHERLGPPAGSPQGRVRDYGPVFKEQLKILAGKLGEIADHSQVQSQFQRLPRLNY